MLRIIEEAGEGKASEFAVRLDELAEKVRGRCW